MILFFYLKHTCRLWVLVRIYVFRKNTKVISFLQPLKIAAPPFQNTFGIRQILLFFFFDVCVCVRVACVVKKQEEQGHH